MKPIEEILKDTRLESVEQEPFEDCEAIIDD